MKDILVSCLGVLIYGSGFLFWPICALLWHRKRRTTTLRRVFLAQLAGNLVLAGLALLSIIKLEHGYDWFILSILLNIVFTPLAFGAAIYDFGHGKKRAAEKEGEDNRTCVQCGGKFRIGEMIAFDSHHVCARCKPVFLQKLAEGTPIEPPPSGPKV